MSGFLLSSCESTINFGFQIQHVGFVKIIVGFGLSVYKITFTTKSLKNKDSLHY